MLKLLSWFQVKSCRKLWPAIVAKVNRHGLGKKGWQAETVVPSDLEARAAQQGKAFSSSPRHFQCTLLKLPSWVAHVNSVRSRVGDDHGAGADKAPLGDANTVAD